MSKYTFTIETEDLDELDVYHKAHENSYIVFELRNNFHRRFKSLPEDLESKSFYEGIEYVLDKLNELLNEYD